MKKYLALFLVATLAVSALGAAGVVTTKKVTAADAAPYEVVVEEGRAYTYTRSQLNWHETFLYGQPTGPHVERSVASTAYAFQSARAQSDYSTSSARIGVKWNLVSPSGNWEDVENMHSTLTVTLSYKLSIEGSASARIRDPQYTVDWAGTMLGETHPDTVTVKKITLVYEGNGGELYDPWWINNLRDGFFLQAGASLGPSAARESASAQLTIDSIEISFHSPPP